MTESNTNAALMLQHLTSGYKGPTERLGYYLTRLAYDLTHEPPTDHLTQSDIELECTIQELLDHAEISFSRQHPARAQSCLESALERLKRDTLI